MILIKTTRKLLNRWIKKETDGYTNVPLFWVTFNYEKYQKEGKENTCTVHLIDPDLSNDKFVREHLEMVIDHIRNEYDMEKIVKI